jgi:hypothetical protein
MLNRFTQTVQRDTIPKTSTPVNTKRSTTLKRTRLLEVVREKRV